MSPGLGKETTTPGSQSRDGADKGRRALAAPKAGGGQNREEARRPQLPRALGGVSVRDTPLPRARTWLGPPLPGSHIPRAPSQDPASPPK